MSKEGHRFYGCERSHNECVQKLNEEKSRIAAGEFIRCAALSQDNPERVKVIFRGVDSEMAFFMARETYNAIPLMVIASVEDYRKHGEVLEAANTDIYQNS